MTTYDTDPPPVHDDPVGPVLRQAADDCRAWLAGVADDPRLTSVATAQTLIRCSRDALVQRVADAELDAIAVGGRLYLNAAQVQAEALRQRNRSGADADRWSTLTRSALTAYLAARPVTASWIVSIREQRPLVCRRRGRRWVDYGIAHHSVVLAARWVGEHTMTLHESHPELVAMPIGPTLLEVLGELDGVHTASRATPLDPDGQDHRLTRYVRLDTDVWPVQVPDDVAALIGPPDVDPGQP